jgi:hypothetical protein
MFAALLTWVLGNGWKYLAAVALAAAVWGTYQWEYSRGLSAGEAAQSAITAKVQAAFDAYKVKVAGDLVKAQGEFNLQKAQLQKALADAQAGLAASQAAEGSKDKELKELLASAKPTDVRPLGPVARAYFDRLRNASH